MKNNFYLIISKNNILIKAEKMILFNMLKKNLEFPKKMIVTFKIKLK